MAEDVVAIARSWIGTLYQHQASVKGVACDCLGLVRGIWRELYDQESITLPAYTPDWGECGGQEVLLNAALRYLAPVTSASQLQCGDVLLFRMRAGAVAKHLGILSHADQPDRFIHAYNGHGVIDSPLTAPWQSRIAARFRFP